MKSIIKSAKTIEEAVKLAREELKLGSSEVEVEVIQEPTKGLFGIFGGQDAVVKVKEKEKIKIDLDDIFADLSKPSDSLQDDKEKDLESKYARFNEDEDEDEDLDKEDLYVEEEVYLEDINEDEEDFDLESEEKEEVTAKSHTDQIDETDDLFVEGYKPEEDDDEDEDEDFEDHHDSRKEYEVFTSREDQTQNTRDLEFSGQALIVTNDDSLQEVAEKAKRNLEDILVKMHIDAKVSYETARDNIVNYNLTDISENDTGIVIGAKGETLNAIQYVLSLLVNNGTNKFYRLTVNVGNYRDRRKKTIEANAQRVAYKVLKTKKSIAMKPMNSYERRIVHTALQNYKEVETVSSGKFPNRKVIVKYIGL